MNALLTEAEIAAKFKRSKRTMRDWRVRRLIPYYDLGGRIFYDLAKVEAAIQKFERVAEVR